MIKIFGWGFGQFLPPLQGLDLVIERGQRIRHVRTLGQSIKPRKVREQQPVGIAAPHRHLLPMIEHRLLPPVQRAVGQHLLGIVPGTEQGRIPGPRQSG